MIRLKIEFRTETDKYRAINITIELYTIEIRLELKKHQLISIIFSDKKSKIRLLRCLPPLLARTFRFIRV